MDGTLIHIAFDAIAWLAAGLSLFWLTKSAHVRFPEAPTGDLGYVAALVFGAGVGAVLFGSANLWLSHLPGIARSIEGAIFGGIVAVELYKRMAGIKLRTGARFALPLAVGVAVGRVGCFFSGLDDFTHGTRDVAALGPRLRRRDRAPSGAALRERHHGGVRGVLRVACAPQ